MSKKSKNKKKKISAKTVRYAKFHKEKPGVLDISMPILSDEQNKQKMMDQDRLASFLRNNRNLPTKEVSERRMRSKR